MTSSGPDETSPPPELQGLDPKDLLQAGLETVPPVTLPPQAVDPDATIPVARPQSTQPAAQVELPLPEELTKLLPGGTYHVESFLGQGGMGAVYKGMQVRLKRPVAIKIMRRDMGKDYDFEARFEREAQAMAKLNHPNIVSVIDFGEAGPDYLYIVMELIDGADLMDVIRGGQMTQAMALSLLPQICDALQFAHDHGIVHRDIKPSNIMLTRDGRVKMCDFGLAKRYDVESSFRTQTGTGMGTPDYAAPEQFDPKANIDHRADIYALGVMIYQMITGQLPRGVWKPPSQRAQIAPQWDDIVSRAMQSDPSDRYQQASEVKTDVSSIPLGKEGSAGTPARPSSKRGEDAKTNEAHKSVRAPVQSRAPLIFGLLVGAVVIALGTFFAMSGKPNDSAMASDASQESTLGSIMPNATTLKLPGIPVLPEDGWRPLFTETEWKETEKYDASQREFKDGLMHLQGKGLRKPQPAADGAIRARIHMRDDTKLPGLVMRFDTQKRAYSLGLQSDKKAVTLNYVEGNSEGAKLATLRLPTPVQPGQTIVLELRVQGDRLIALSDGQLVADVRDSQLKDPGEWGIGAVDAWFESVEVQTLPVGDATPPWIDVLAAWWQGKDQRGGWVKEKGGGGRLANLAPTASVSGLRLAGDTSTPPAFNDQAIRARFRLGGSPYVQLCLCRATAAGDLASGYYVSLSAGMTRLVLSLDSPGMPSHAELAALPLPKGFDHAAAHTMELRLANKQLTLSLDGQTIYQKPHSERSKGYPMFLARQGAIVESLEIADLGGEVVSPSPSPAVSKPSTQFPPVNWVDFTADFRSKSKSKLKTEGDWSEPTANVWHRLPAPSSSKDLAVRVKFANRAEVRFRKTGKGDSERFYRMGLGGNVSRAVIARSENKQQIDLVRNSIELATDNSEHEMIAAIRGDSLELWLDGTPVASAKDGMLKTGEVEFVMYTDNDAPFRTRKLEYALLEPAHPVSVASWKATDFSTLDESAFKEEAKASSILNGQIVGLRAKNSWKPVIPAPIRNGAVRATILWQAETNLPRLLFRQVVGQPRYYLGAKTDGSTEVGIKSATGEPVLKTFPGTAAYKPGDKVVLQLAAVGSKLAFWCDGSLLGTLDDAQVTAAGAPAIQAECGDFVSFEYLNLDGLPEAEALRLLGVDEQGKDLRGKAGAAK